MTDAQWKVRVKQITDETRQELRAFRKECVTRGLVKFKRDACDSYVVYYRERYIATLFGTTWDDHLRLSSMWNAIRIAEDTIKAIEGVNHGE